MRLLDLFCCGGGAAMGYHRAGFEVTGIDNKPQPHYPFTFIQADAIQYVKDHGHEYDVIHASPPCQRYSAMTRSAKTQDQHPDLVGPVRQALLDSDKPYIIENVPGAPLIAPVVLCGTMFRGLKVYRHRLFESNVPLVAPAHGRHTERFPRAGKGANANGWVSVAGGGPDTALKRIAMGIDWMPRDRLSQAIPPAYTEYLGKQLIAHLEQ